MIGPRAGIAAVPPSESPAWRIPARADLRALSGRSSAVRPAGHRPNGMRDAAASGCDDRLGRDGRRPQDSARPRGFRPLGGIGGRAAAATLRPITGCRVPRARAAARHVLESEHVQARSGARSRETAPASSSTTSSTAGCSTTSSTGCSPALHCGSWSTRSPTARRSRRRSPSRALGSPTSWASELRVPHAPRRRLARAGRSRDSYRGDFADEPESSEYIGLSRARSRSRSTRR